MRALPTLALSPLLACTPAPVSDTAAPAPVEPARPVAVVEPARPAAVAAPTPAAPAPRPAAWPAAVLVPAGFDFGRAALTVGDGGDLVLRHSVQDTTSAAVAERWTETLTAGGYTARAPCTQPPGYSCTWIGPDRIVELSAEPGWADRGVDVVVHWLPAGHTPVARLPGPCVKPPQRARTIDVVSMGIDQFGERHQDSSYWRMGSDVGADLDGDGAPEIYVPHASQGRCPWDIPHDVYVMRGACGHLVGTIVGTLDDDATRLSRFEHGLRVAHTRASWTSHVREHPDPVHHTRTWTYTFDGRRLRQTDASAGDGVCHHCGVTRCREERGRRGAG